MVCLLDIREGESIKSREWENRTVIPILGRSTILPKHFGNSSSDIGHGEAVAYCLQEECFHPLLPRCVIMDSKSVRNRILGIRDGAEFTERAHIRKVMNGIGKTVVSRLENNILKWNKEEELLNNKIALELGNRLKQFSDVSQYWIDSQAREILNSEESDKTWDREYYDDHFLRCILKVDSHQLNRNGDGISRNPRYENILPNLALTNANHFADIAAEDTLKIKTENLQDLDEYPDNTYLIPDSNLRFFLAWENKSVDKNTNKFIQNKLHDERKKRLGLKSTQGLGQRILEFSDLKWQNVNFDRGWIRALLGFSNTHTRSFYKSICYRIGTLIEEKKNDSMNKKEICNLQNSLLVNSINMNKNHHLLYCTWCNEQRNTSLEEKLKLGKNLKGNRRHVYFFCKNRKVRKFREGMDEEIESTCRKFMSTFNYCGSPSTSTLILHKIQNLLLRLQSDNVGRLQTTSVPIKNYLSIKEWCCHFDIRESDINHKLMDINILSHIMGFGSALKDGELADHSLGVVDCIHTGAFPSLYEKLVISEITIATTGWRKDELHIHLKEKMLQLWKDLKEMVMIKFKGIHKICSVVSKEKENEFKKRYNLSRKGLILSREELKSKKRKFADIDEDDEKLCLDKRKCKKSKQNLQISDLWSKPKRCLGLTCGDNINFWNCFTTFKPNWLPLGIRKCDRCGRYVNAMKKAHTTLSNIKNSFQELDEDTRKEILSLIRSPQKHMNDLAQIYYFFNSGGNSSKRIKRRRSADTRKSKISENDRLAILIIGKALSCEYNKEFKMRRRKIIRFAKLTIKNSTSSKSRNTCPVCFNLFNYEREKICAGIQNEKTELQTDFCCHLCFVYNACALATSEIKTCLEDNFSFPTRRKTTNINTKSSVNRNSKKIDTDICTAIGLNSPNNTSRDDMNLLISSKGQPISSILMQIIITDIKRWIYRKDIFIAKADCSNLLYNSGDITWKDWASKFKTSMDDKRIPEGWFFFPICCGNIKQAIWHLLIIHKWKGVVRGWSFEFTKTKSRNTSPAIKHLSSLFNKKIKIEWKTCKKCQITDTDSGVVVAVKIACCIWALTNMGDMNQLLNKLTLLNFDVDPDLSITSARNFLSRIQGKHSEIAEYLEKITDCGRKRKKQD